MPVEFLTHAEVCELTGARTRAGQIRVLAKNGIRHTIKMNGWPCVTAAAVIGSVHQVPVDIPKWSPRIRND